MLQIENINGKEVDIIGNNVAINIANAFNSINYQFSQYDSLVLTVETLGNVYTPQSATSPHGHK